MTNSRDSDELGISVVRVDKTFWWYLITMTMGLVITLIGGFATLTWSIWIGIAEIKTASATINGRLDTVEAKVDGAKETILAAG